MSTHRFLRSVYVRLGLKLLIWEVVLVGVLWLLYQRVAFLQRFRFSDDLFLVGVLETLTASYGMMGRPYAVRDIPGGIPALPVQPSEEERRAQILDEIIQKNSFATRLIASGLLTILIAVILTLIYQ